MTSTTIKVLLADDHQVVRIGIRSLIAGHYPHAVIEEAATAKDVLDRVKKTAYDLAFLDIQMPDSSDFSLINHVQLLRPDLRIIVFSIASEEIFGPRFLRQGVKAYLSKDVDDTTILKALERVLSGKKYISEKIAEALIENSADDSVTPFQTLSNREIEIIRMLLAGITNSEIAGRLNLTQSTVATHKINIFNKLGVKTLVDLMNLARAHHFQ